MRPKRELVQRQTLACLLVAQGVVIAPLFLYLPLWLALVWLTAVVIRVQVFRGAWQYPGNFAKLLLAVVTVGGLVLQYGLSVGVEPMVGLLLSAFVLKLIEARQRRDLLLIIFIGFIAVGGQFLFSQTIFAFIYGGFSCCALLVAWQSCFTTRTLSPRAHFQRSASLLIQAVPLMLILFLLLPRLPPLWAVPTVQSEAKTGFSETMSPGDIASLSKSSATAFRVTFDGPVPPKSEMYWRALALDRFDGRRWLSGDAVLPRQSWQASAAPPESWRLTPGDLRYDYQIMLEPHREKWLFSLATPVSVKGSAEIAYTSGYGLQARWPVDKRMQYRVTSDVRALRASQGLTPEERQQNLSLPANPANPRARQLAATWQGLAPEQTVARALALFRQDYTYTLQPPPLGTHSIDEFLFVTRRGFCEHFAGSFVFLMRAAGIPARVVLGYQGGEQSQVGEYWLVRQSASHAWAEVWLPERGWTRVDPTGAVAPDRLELGLRDAVGAEQLYLAGGETLLTAQDWPWLQYLEHHWDAFGYAWHRSVLGFDSDAQNDFLNRWLGGSSPWRVGAAMIALGAIVVFSYGFIIWLRGRPPAASLELRLLKQAERRLGLQRHAGEAPAQWAGRVAALHPERARHAHQIARLFEAAIYAGRGDALNKLQKAVKAVPKYA